ncbi:hypothetical protein C456_06832 [Haloferax volcanii DSM 14919]|uniref:Uncharacterized protein n=1 Tax=Haloferax lucentense (strain DSM 14919 / JCM 9276 / NCIMB 13854 / Aa 2.2) TaxID=1230452 RepID=M0GUV6_HALL2|nr:hypothetical protein C456_06832 [Haloferax lucentense DSM 14919]
MIAYRVDPGLVDSDDRDAGLVRPNTLVGDGDIPPTGFAIERDVAFVGSEVDRRASRGIAKFDVDSRLLVRLRDHFGGESTLAKFAIRPTAHR